MKNSTQILSHLQHRPQFSRLSHHACIRSVQRLFPPHLQRMIRFGYIRNGILFFVFSHPGAKQEFDIIIDSIKTPLKSYPPQTCASSSFDDIRAFVSHKRPTSPSFERHTAIDYQERSKGTFSNHTTNKKVHDLIEEIRHSIHDRTD